MSLVKILGVYGWVERANRPLHTDPEWAQIRRLRQLVFGELLDLTQKGLPVPRLEMVLQGGEIAHMVVRRRRSLRRGRGWTRLLRLLGPPLVLHSQVLLPLLIQLVHCPL